MQMVVVKGSDVRHGVWQFQSKKGNTKTDRRLPESMAVVRVARVRSQHTGAASQAWLQLIGKGGSNRWEGRKVRG
jgi:hypothetical protein